MIELKDVSFGHRRSEERPDDGSEYIEPEVEDEVKWLF